MLVSSDLLVKVFTSKGKITLITQLLCPLKYSFSFINLKDIYFLSALIIHIFMVLSSDQLTKLFPSVEKTRLVTQLVCL